MNRYVDILNRIRQHADLSWLTPSQRQAYQLLVERLKFLDELNLWGCHGAGKTFLAWMLSKHGVCAYVPCREELAPALLFRTVIFESSGWRRPEVRDNLRHCRGMGYDKVILITTEAVQDQLSQVKLSLTTRDVEQVVTNLRSIRVMPFSESPQNLWELVRPLV